MLDAPYKSLYRRYRPQKFAEVLGQEHVVKALSHAVRDQRVGHAYLFSGPRGTGKTSVARILAKALNCEHAVDGDPDDTCDACVRVREGTSLDVHELDAASNNGVEAMRDLVSRAALGTPGRWKVYIVDEVHMLSTAASNALLKTLEEPPAHVVFVLATTDPQKVLPTIRSRTQHFEFRLLSPDLLVQLVEQIKDDAGLEVPDDAVAHVVRRGRGSARDTLSVLDQIAAAGIIDDETEVLDEIVEAICERDAARAFTALAEACNTGREPQRLCVELLEYVRNCFLSLMSKGLVPLADEAVVRVEEQARRLGPARTVASMEVLGRALHDMRDAPDARITFEVALVHLTHSEDESQIDALVKRIERLERAQQHADHSGTETPSHALDSPAHNAHVLPREASASSVRDAIAREPTGVASQRSTQPSHARSTLGGLRRPGAPTLKRNQSSSSKQAEISTETVDAANSASASASASSNSTAAQTPTSSAPLVGGSPPSRDQLVQDWGDVILEKLPQRARARYKLGCFLEVDESRAKFALPNSVHRTRCEEVRHEVEAVLREHYGVRVPLELVVDSAADPNAPASFSPSAKNANAQPVIGAESQDNKFDISDGDDEFANLGDTTIDATQEVQTPADKLLKAFPGAEDVSDRDI